MKKRIITGVLAALFCIGVLCLMKTVVLPVVVALFAVLAVFEIERVSGLKEIPIMVFSFVPTVCMPFYFHFSFNLSKQFFLSAAIAYIISMLVIMLVFFDTVKFEQVVIAIFASMVIPFSFSTVILLRDVGRINTSYLDHEGIFYILFGMFCSWLTDTFAYFVGSRLGKHKLCPNISPKKTVEGAIGGIVGATAMSLLLLLVFKRFVFADGAGVSYLFVGALAPLLSIVSMAGDLTASTLKRNFGVKDFGTLFPGHGGVMDRMDSFSFVMPVLYSFVLCVL